MVRKLLEPYLMALPLPTDSKFAHLKSGKSPHAYRGEMYALIALYSTSYTSAGTPQEINTAAPGTHPDIIGRRSASDVTPMAKIHRGARKDASVYDSTWSSSSSGGNACVQASSDSLRQSDWQTRTFLSIQLPAERV